MTTGQATGTSPNVDRVRRGDREVIEILGIHLEWRVREADTNGHYCVLEMTVPAGAGVPLHEHGYQETFFVVEGQAEFGRIVAGELEWFAVEAGDTVNVPIWTMHGFRNPGNEVARINLTCSQGLEQFFDEVGTPVPAGAPLPTGQLDPAEIERVVRIATKHGQRFAPFPPS